MQSTVLKQMKLIHHGGYNDQERDSYKEIIYSNTIQSMRSVMAFFSPTYHVIIITIKPLRHMMLVIVIRPNKRNQVW